MDQRAVLLFDIDGVIRDVSGSYRRAIVETVHHYSGWRPDPALIDALKGEGRWNNDWEASLELLRRRAVAEASAGSGGGAIAGAGASPGSGQAAAGTAEACRDRGSAPQPVSPSAGSESLPSLQDLAEVFGGFYFGGDPEGDPAGWRGFIGSEPLLVDTAFFTALEARGIGIGFVSGAEPPSVRFVLERRLGLLDPPTIAMGDAPDKPDPSGFLRLAERLCRRRGLAGLGPQAPPVAYLGDTVADVTTVLRAREQRPDQRFWSLAVAPPHLHAPDRAISRHAYEQRLRQAGADRILPSTSAVLDSLEELLETL